MTLQKQNPYRNGNTNLGALVHKAIAEVLRPPTRLTLSQWADQYAYLSAETSADAGKFRSFGYQVGMLDAITDPSVKQVSIIKSARVGFTKLLDHVVGFYIHQDPSPILIVQPTVADAEDYSRTEIAPMLRDTPVLAEISGDLKAKDSNQRVNKRMFVNGSSVAFVGANAASGFRRITARIVAFDEVDGYPVSGAGDEGDQIALGTKRTETFWNRKIILGSTPTLKGVSRIEKAYGESDQRRYHIPCPHCQHMQTLRWENMHWDKEKDATGRTTKHKPETAYFVCEANGCIIQEHDKPRMIDNGRWIADKPFSGHAGFHIWAAYSLFPNAAWKHLVAEFLRVRQDPTLLQTFVNLVQGQTSIKNPVRAYAAANITLSGTQTVDGVALAVGDSVAAGGQTTATQNNIYVVASGAWAPRSDTASGGQWAEGTEFLVAEGTNYAGAIFRQTTSGSITLGTTALAFTQGSKINQYSGDGTTVSLTGMVFSVHYGYGLTTTSGALGVDTTIFGRKYSTTITTDGTNSSFTVTHALSTTDVIVGVRDSSGSKVFVDDNPANTSSISISFGSVPAQGLTYRVTVIG